MGSRPLYEERVLSWNGIVALRRAQREPASVYHDIFANQGWLLASDRFVAIPMD